MSLHLTVSHSIIDGKSRRITHLTDGSDTKEIFHDFDRLLSWSDSTLLDGHVLIILLYAMSRGQTLYVHGTLSNGIVRNLEELQLAWQLWKPSIYKKIQVIPDRIIDARRIRNDNTIAAFSGGVDGTFTALRHTALLPDPIRYPLTDVLMVHGFDVLVNNHDHFNQLYNRVLPILNELGLAIRVVRTNSKEELQLDWTDVFGLQLAGCLHMMSDEFQYCLIGSGEPYDLLLFPWGSTPATDYLMSGDQMTVIHDGAAFSRTAKIAELLAVPTACKTLKVCWMGQHQGENCGVCEKCVRTRLNFHAAGMVSPPCFDTALDVSLIRELAILNMPQLAELQSIVDYAERRGIRADWLTLLKIRLAKGITNYEPNVIKGWIIALLDRLGLKDLARTLWRRIKHAVC